MNKPLFYRYFCLLPIVAHVVNVFLWKAGCRRYIKQSPELAEGYRRFFLAMLILGSLPWLVLGIDLGASNPPRTKSYLDPWSANPYVVAWQISMVALWLLGGYWLFLRRGAEFLIEHPGLINYHGKNPTMIRRFYGFMTLCVVVGLYLTFTNRLPSAHH